MALDLIQLGAGLIEMIGALMLLAYLVSAIAVLLRRQGPDQARLIVADGVIMALSFKLAATVLKTMSLISWEQIAMLAMILFFRTMLKRLFTWEQKRLVKQDQGTAFSR